MPLHRPCIGVTQAAFLFEVRAKASRTHDSEGGEGSLETRGIAGGNRPAHDLGVRADEKSGNGTAGASLPESAFRRAR